MMRNIAFLLFFSVFTTNLYAGICKVEGTAPAYAGKKIVFQKFYDRITMLEQDLFTVTVDSKGYFSGQCELDKTCMVFAETGIYFAYFYMEPGCNYDIILPEYIEKTKADELNPFFEPESVHIGIKNMKKTDLNYLIMDFDYFYDEYVDESMFEIYVKGMESDVDTFINEIDSHFSYKGNPYFNTYKKFKYVGLRYLAYQRNRPEVAFKNLTFDSVYYENPAYMEIFGELYSNFFDNQLNELIGPRLFWEVNYGHSITNIKLLLSYWLELQNPRLKELAILKGIHDAFYNDNYAWTPLLLCLDSLCIVTAYPEHRVIGQNIADKVLTMAEGTVAPHFALPDTLGDTVKLSNYRNQFVYLNFINTDSYTCQQQLELLKTIYEKHNQYFKVVSVVVDSDVAKAKRYLNAQKYTWDFVFTGGDKTIPEYYKIVAYPSYFLVSPSGFLIYSPAPGPLEGFEKAFFSLINDD
ncbi:MAG TPA: redoxin domain-containing protein [Bacteroidales bacterium]|nr:redoxin domain-containing protein [Bacteroidales bacterium]HQP04195.1 redoxin domain-containing protein [Bacteroidales bacterium]